MGSFQFRASTGLRKPEKSCSLQCRRPPESPWWHDQPARLIPMPAPARERASGSVSLCFGQATPRPPSRSPVHLVGWLIGRGMQATRIAVCFGQATPRPRSTFVPVTGRFFLPLPVFPAF
jgi:hypothetical protein